MAAIPPVRRALFVLTILTGSFLLFMVQPMIARMALPQLGGAPNVWNSAMLVFQALLLGGYLYAHFLGRLSLRKQAITHLGLLTLAGLTLPLSLAKLPTAAPGSEVWWVPLLFLASVGPVFLLMSAQAPLMQRWFAANPAAGEPWALYAASNVGSFTGLMAYPLIAEPLLPVESQSVLWSLGYLLLLILVAWSARARWNEGPAPALIDTTLQQPIGWRRIALWLALSAVPSGLMLSTTTHLTTDIFAMPLLWVVPLGLYLLSFTIAFSEKRSLAQAMALLAPPFLILVGGFAMASQSSGSIMMALTSVLLLFILAVVLHARLYDLRPAPSQLTLFYVVMSAGGALGGLFTALIAPLMFDWVWEHPLLILAAAMLIPVPALFDWRRMRDLDPQLAKIGVFVLLLTALLLAWLMIDYADQAATNVWVRLTIVGMAIVGVLLIRWRAAFAAVLWLTMLAQGGLSTIDTTLDHARSRSYFGIYTVRENPEQKLRTLAHGTTLHGQQSTDPALRRMTQTYYGPGSGAGLTISRARILFGPKARIGIVGLGTGTLACLHRPGQSWTFFEIDPVVVEFSRNGTFSYLQDCAPDATIVLGDARLKLAAMPKASYDILAIDAFSSDAIPLHLLTREALDIYLKALAPNGVLMIHISNRFIDLEPVLSALIRERKLYATVRKDNPADRTYLTPSTWIAISPQAEQLAKLSKDMPANSWTPLQAPAAQLWTDSHASILPFIEWPHLIGNYN